MDEAMRDARRQRQRARIVAPLEWAEPAGIAVGFGSAAPRRRQRASGVRIDAMLPEPAPRKCDSPWASRTAGIV